MQSLDTMRLSGWVCGILALTFGLLHRAIVRFLILLDVDCAQSIDPCATPPLQDLAYRVLSLPLSLLPHGLISSPFNFSDSINAWEFEIAVNSGAWAIAALLILLAVAKRRWARVAVV
jgi:hypothetical protein